MSWLISIKGHFIMIVDPYTLTAPIVQEHLSSLLHDLRAWKGDITGITGIIFCHEYFSILSIANSTKLGKKLKWVS